MRTVWALVAIGVAGCDGDGYVLMQRDAGAACGPEEICRDGVDNDCDGITDSWSSCGGAVAWGCDTTSVSGLLRPSYQCMHRFRWTIDYADCPQEIGQDDSCTLSQLDFVFPRPGCSPMRIQTQYEPCDGVTGRIEFACGIGGDNSFPFDSPAAIEYCGW